MIRLGCTVFAFLGALLVLFPYLGLFGLGAERLEYLLLPVLTGSFLLVIASARHKRSLALAGLGFVFVLTGSLIPWLYSAQTQGPQMSAGLVMICGIFPIGITMEFVGAGLSICRA